MKNMLKRIAEMFEKKGMNVYELEAQFCTSCNLYKIELTLDELKTCWGCHEYRRTGKVV
jgi:hypothetical protein